MLFNRVAAIVDSIHEKTGYKFLNIILKNI